jgi:murein DD-endopeptidase MepM/ murein hydrolase activator NlpD
MNRFRLDALIIVIISVLCLFIVWFNFTGGEDKVKLSIIPEEEQAEPVIIYKYGLPVDSFDMITGKVRNNQMLSNLLDDLGINPNIINALVQKASGIFDVRKFKSGNRYVGYRRLDSLSSLTYLVYEKDPVNYVVFQFADSLNVWGGAKQIDTVRKSFEGSIQSSLWNMFADHSANPVLANFLSEIYAWSIDFFGLQVGDSLRVVYDELYVDSSSMGIGKIYGAWFKHMGTEFWAIPFVQDSIESFFDDKGKSLRKAFLKAPLRFSRISSRFSNSRMHPILKIRRPHHGIDYAAPVGTPVNSIGDGVIVKTGYEGGSGNMVKIKHNSVYSTAYLHLYRYASGIKPGAYVKQGDVIGYVGSTGLSTGPHLDFRFYKNGFSIDPLKVEAPPVDPVKTENLAEYEEVKKEVMGMVGSF